MKFVFALALGTTLGLSLAGAPSSQTPVKTGAVVTDAQVQHWLKTWQKRLSLDDWEISARVVRSRDLKPDTLGNLHWNSVTKTAVVRLMDPSDYNLPPAEIPTDMEYTVVHELVHLQLATLPKAAGSKDVEERIVNGIGEALFALEKGQHYKPRAAFARGANSKDKPAFEANRSVK